MTDVAFTANSEADLNADLVTAAGEAAGTNVAITLAADIAETGQLEAINLASGVTLTLDGQGHTLDGANTYQGIFVYSGDVTIENLTIQNAVAHGGAGAAAGGGGAGLGGGLFVAGAAAGGATTPMVTVSGVNFSRDSADGGTGGGAGSEGAVGGGGGLGGAGGAGGPGGQVGGGGGIGVGADGASSGGSAGSGSVPGVDSGGGGVNSGGGVGASGADGGFGGGGGGGAGHGGFGGGGAAAQSPGDAGAAGGFGGGGGGGLFAAGGSGGFGAGAGDRGGGGGGGLGAGGDIFVQQGATLVVLGGSMSGGSVMSGQGSSGGGNGAAYGSGVFLQGDQTVTFASLGVSYVFDVIADQTGSGGTGSNAGAGRVVIGYSSTQGGMTTTTAGTVIFSAADTYTGVTTIQHGTLALSGAGAIASSVAVTIAGGAGLDISAATSGTTINELADGAAGSGAARLLLGAKGLTVNENSAATFSGVISDGGLSGAVGGGLTLQGAGALTLSGVSTYTGKTQVYGTLDLSGSGSIASAKNLALKVSGATFDISGADANETINTLTGVAGTGIDLGAHALTVDQTTAATFAGVVSNGGVAGGVGGGLVVDGTAALTLTAAQAYTGKTQIHGELDLSGGGALGSSKAVVLKEAGAVFDISGVNRPETILNLAGVAGSHIDLGANGLKVNQSTAANYSGVISDGGVDGGTGGSLTVKGTATLTLSGHNTFTGGLKLIGGEVELAASNAAGSNNHDVTFSGAATLEIDAAALSGSTNAHSFANAIDGFAASDTIDLSSLAYVQGHTTATNAGGQVIVTDGMDSVSLTLNGLSALSLATANDGHGGTLFHL